MYLHLKLNKLYKIALTIFGCVFLNVAYSSECRYENHPTKMTEDFVAQRIGLALTYPMNEEIYTQTQDCLFYWLDTISGGLRSRFSWGLLLMVSNNPNFFIKNLIKKKYSAYNIWLDQLYFVENWTMGKCPNPSPIEQISITLLHTTLQTEVEKKYMNQILEKVKKLKCKALDY